MAKVLVSMPDELLERVDTRAKALGESRSGYLQRLAERELEEGHKRWRQEIRELMEELAATEPDAKVPHVDAAQLIREDRESH